MLLSTTFTVISPSKKTGSHEVFANGVNVATGNIRLSNIFTANGADLHPAPGLPVLRVATT